MRLDLFKLCEANCKQYNIQDHSLDSNQYDLGGEGKKPFKRFSFI